MDIGYIAVETFIPPQNYVTWSKLNQLKQVISLDCALCPRIIDCTEDDYSHVIWMGENCFCKDLDWLMKKVEDKLDKEILAIAREPEVDCKNLLSDRRFKFYGYDLIEDDTSISALTNCGGFDKAFHSRDISKYGLIEDFTKAKEVQLKLKDEYPDVCHADCTLWAVWRMEG